MPPAINSAKKIFVSNAGADSGLFPELLSEGSGSCVFLLTLPGSIEVAWLQKTRDHNFDETLNDIFLRFQALAVTMPLPDK
jgi:hypothetical protein